ncbi:sigma-54 dependent transcriptional regulator [Desulfobacterales bacterium HSG17]|nr:sigma-54 dependent transcriptional regulator [Desulfobacterales bacterium HSG17]
MIMEKPNVLVVDDDDAHRIMLKTLVGGWGYTIVEANDGSIAVNKVKEQVFDLVLMDIRMVQMSGLEALAEMKNHNPSVPVVIMTAFSSVETAIEALKNGAHDYLIKPLDFEKLRLTIERAVEHTRLKEENRTLRRDLSDRFDRSNIIGNSMPMTRLLEMVSQVAPSEATVLITGESGTGKELIAGAIHYNSLRKMKPFIRINCAAITESLLESEMFGHEKGAFTGADRRKEGRFLQADGGSLFLDEVSEMPLIMQAKLLRVLQEREFTRVGGESVISVDVRLIAATNKNLLQMVQSGTFREDLYYRLNVVTLDVPPLRSRSEDIPLLASHFLTVFAERNKKTLKGFTPKAMEGLIRYDWPGNVRELMNAIERGVVLARGEFLDTSDFPVLPEEDSSLEGISPDMHVSVDGGIPLEQIEKQAILQTLEAAAGNKSEAARRLGITRKTLHKKLKAYGVM